MLQYKIKFLFFLKRSAHNPRKGTNYLAILVILSCMLIPTNDTQDTKRRAYRQGLGGQLIRLDSQLCLFSGCVILDKTLELSEPVSSTAKKTASLSKNNLRILKGGRFSPWARASASRPGSFAEAVKKSKASAGRRWGSNCHLSGKAFPQPGRDSDHFLINISTRVGPSLELGSLDKKWSPWLGRE